MARFCVASLIILFIAHRTLAQGGGTSTSTSTSTSTGGDTNAPPPPAGGGGAGGAYNYPPPPAGGGLPLGGFGGGFPFFPGFYKNLDFSAGAGYGPFGGLGGGFPGGFPGGLGGLGGLLGGGVPPPDVIDGDIPPDGGLGGFGGPFGGGFGGFGPSYVPSTWIGSALGAKGDLLFPIVIFIFFVVGVWTVIQLLLGFIVPLIASKLALKAPLKGLGDGLLFRRSLDGSNVVGSPAVSPDLDFITNSVLDAINEPKCLKYVACNAGKFLNGMAGGGNQANSTYEGILKTLSQMARSDALNLFEEAFINPAQDCTQYTCDKTEDVHTHPSPLLPTNSSDPKTNEVH